MDILNITSYRFVPLPHPMAQRDEWRAILTHYGCLGTVLLAEEGINLCLAGKKEAIHGVMQWCRGHDIWHGLDFRKSWSTFVPFRRLRVKIKAEIITMRAAAGSCPVDPTRLRTVAPADFQHWLSRQCDEDGRPLIALDVRNHFEYEAGHFIGAHHLTVARFSAFPQKMQASSLAKDHTIVAYCTGGIRCEKACTYLSAAGWQHVYLLQGGILQYFACVGVSQYQGNCIVFDERRALTPALHPIAFRE